MPKQGASLAGNDVFRAKLVGGTTTLTYEDFIDGGEGYDTLVLYPSAGEYSSFGTMSNVEKIEVHSLDRIMLYISERDDIQDVHVTSRDGGYVALGNATTLTGQTILGDGVMAISTEGKVHFSVLENHGGTFDVVNGSSESVDIANQFNGVGGMISIRGGGDIRLVQTNSNLKGTSATNSYVSVASGGDTAHISIENAPAAQGSSESAGVELSDVVIWNETSSKMGLQHSAKVSNAQSLSISDASLTKLELSNVLDVYFSHENVFLARNKLDLKLAGGHFVNVTDENNYTEIALQAVLEDSIIDNFNAPLTKKVAIDVAQGKTLQIGLSENNLALESITINGDSLSNQDGVVTAQIPYLSGLKEIDASKSQADVNVTVTQLNGTLRAGAANTNLEVTGIDLNGLLFDGKNGRDTLILSALAISSNQGTLSSHVKDVERLAVKTDMGGELNLTDIGSFIDVDLIGSGSVWVSGLAKDVQLLNATGLAAGGLHFTSAQRENGLIVYGSKQESNYIDVSLAGNKNQVVGSDKGDVIVVNGLSNHVDLGANADGNFDVLTITEVSKSRHEYTSIAQAHAGATIFFPAHGSALASFPVVLSSGSSFNDYLNAAVLLGGNATENGLFTWFQFGGDTYLVESRHDGITNAQFVDGVDMILKFVGLHDLRGASINSGQIILS